MFVPRHGGEKGAHIKSETLTRCCKLPSGPSYWELNSHASLTESLELFSRSLGVKSSVIDWLQTFSSTHEPLLAPACSEVCTTWHFSLGQSSLHLEVRESDPVTFTLVCRPRCDAMVT